MKTFEEFLSEANGIKGWKNAHNDIAKQSARTSAASSEWHTVVLKKNGEESKMHDAKKAHKSEEDAVGYSDRIKKLNAGHPGHALYQNHKFVRKL